MTRKNSLLFRISIGMSIVFCSMLSVSLSQEAIAPFQKPIWLGAGNQWTYRVQISKDAHLIFDPHFVHPDLGATSLTNGEAAKSRGPEEIAFTIKCGAPISDSSYQATMEEAGLALWLSVRATEERLALVPRGIFVTYELHAVTEIGKDGKDGPWIAGQILALLPAQSSQKKVEVLGWLEGVKPLTIIRLEPGRSWEGQQVPTWTVEPLTESVQVPAGEFSKGFHSLVRKPQSNMSSVPAHTIESWIAEKVGLIKYVSKGPKDNVLVTLELSSYLVK